MGLEERTQGEAAWPPRHVLCVGSIVLRDQQVLLVRQAAGTSLAGQWTVPWGLVDAAEPPHTAAIRETAEEANVQASMMGLLGTQHIGWQDATALVYCLAHEAGEPAGDGHETDAASYFSQTAFHQLQEPIEPWTAWIVPRIFERMDQLTLIPPIQDNPFQPRLAFL